MLIIDIPLLVPDHLTLDQYIGKGLQPNEGAMPEESTTPAPIEPTFDPVALDQLTSMGFPEIRCKKALLAVPGDVEGAMNWLFQHMDDPDIDAPLQFSSKGSAPEPDPGLVAMLQDMGFTPAQAKKALRETVRTTCNRLVSTESQTPEQRW
jgi:ubiquitin carboxyl-terminal hydrolase 5/13